MSNIFTMIREAIRAVKEGRDADSVVETLGACAADLTALGHPGDRAEVDAVGNLTRDVIARWDILPLDRNGHLVIPEIDRVRCDVPGWEDAAESVWLDPEDDWWVVDFTRGGPCPLNGPQPDDAPVEHLEPQLTLRECIRIPYVPD